MHLPDVNIWLALTFSQHKHHPSARSWFDALPDGPWRQWSQLETYSHKVWADAYLAAFAQTAGLELVSFDSGFRQYPGLQHTILS
jgi:predicted nucleic acid-binding protein